MQREHAVSNRRPPDDATIDVVRRATVAVKGAVDRVRYPHRGITARFAVLLRDLVTLRNNDVNECEARLLSAALDGVIDDLYHPLTHEQDRIIARIAADADRGEDGMRDLRLIEGDSAHLLEEHARKLDLQASSSRALARSLRAKARVMRQTAEAGRERLGLQPNGVAQ